MIFVDRAAVGGEFAAERRQGMSRYFAPDWLHSVHRVCFRHPFVSQRTFNRIVTIAGYQLRRVFEVAARAADFSHPGYAVINPRFFRFSSCSCASIYFYKFVYRYLDI